MGVRIMQLTTGPLCIRDNPTVAARVDPYNQDSIDAVLCRPQSLPFLLPSLNRLLVHTVEVVDVPAYYSGQVELRSTFARMGLLMPPTYADPGFKGTLTLEIFNGSLHPIVIHPNMHIAEMILIPTPFEPLYEGRYQGQGDSVVPPKALARPS